MSFYCACFGLVFVYVWLSNLLICNLFIIHSGTPDDGVPQKYRLLQGGPIELLPTEEQTLTDASVEFVDGKTVMKFTKPLVEPNLIPITAGENNMLWANGGDGVTTIGYHGENRAPVRINLASGAAEAVSVPNMGAWLAHGICAFIAWGVLAPTAVNSAIYRSLFNGPLWFKLHQFSNASAYALTVIAFVIAVAFVGKEGNPHWFSSHAKMGLSMFIIASVQVLWGAVRPHLPESGEEKTTIRKVWEIKHRFTGTVCWYVDFGKCMRVSNCMQSNIVVLEVCRNKG